LIFDVFPQILSGVFEATANLSEGDITALPHPLNCIDRDA
jgi:hypothetical protein